MKRNLVSLKNELRKFAKKRDWNRFHTPKNLSMALSVEAGEIVEHFQWLTQDEAKNLSLEKKNEVSKEIADVMIYLTRLADVLNIDILGSAFEKIKQNEIKYPVELAYGTAKKHNEL